MAPDLETDTGWIKWILEIWIPISMGWVPVSIALFTNIYKRMERSEQKTESLVGKATASIENKLDVMRKIQDDDQRALSANLQRIAEQIGRLSPMDSVRK